jgi:D-lactate dehydrogenase
MICGTVNRCNRHRRIVFDFADTFERRKKMQKLLKPDPTLLRPREHPATNDCAPDTIASGTPPKLRDDLIKLVGKEQVLWRAIDLVRFACDASPYRLFPKVVVLARNVKDVAAVFKYARQSQIPVTIRSGGTSLSGQAQGDGILLETKRHWAGWNIEEDGRRLRARPGTVMFRANLALAPYGYKLGPDPASLAVCTVGGVVANNSSGMCCGTTKNSYKTVESLTFMLPSGTMINTAEPDAEKLFAASEPALAQGLMEIKQEIETDEELRQRLRRKFSIKNTCGYHMEAFLDGDTPLSIFRRLLIGSEGTLAFVSEVVFKTLAEDKHRLTGFPIFTDLHAAAAAVSPFVKAGAVAVEIFDRASLRAVEGKPGVPERWRQLPEAVAGLLVEFQEKSPEALARTDETLKKIVAGLKLAEPAEFTRDAAVAASFWRVRSGLLPSVGGARPSGTSMIIEDICFAPEHLAEGTLDTQALMHRHKYDGCVFGHAAAGNLHFLIAPSLNTEADVAQFDAFMRDLVELIVGKYDGSLKAEHGTGRNIAPFVEREWGPKLTSLMWKLKKLADPENILAPGVILSKDPEAHLHHLHTTPPLEKDVDRCMECGFCEPVCPSRNLTTTPRQRIAIRREMMRQRQGSPVIDALLADYEYDAIETCAGDGTCSIACPVDINTGVLMKKFRHAEHSKALEKAAENLACNWAAVEVAARAALSLNHSATGILGSLPASAASKAARALVSDEFMPSWQPGIPGAAKSKLPITRKSTAKAVYFTACVNRIFGNSDASAKSPGLAEAMVSVSARAGLPLWLPDDLAGNCCGTVWHSKGFERGNVYMANKIVESMWRWSDGGKLPIVCDATSCTLGITSEIVDYLNPQNREHHQKLTLLDSLTWANDYLLSHLTVKKRLGSVAIHPVCATQHLGLSGKLQALAQALAEKVVTPIHSTCCAFAGDRGLLHPELARAATAEEVNELKDCKYDAYLCSNRTCELGMNMATGEDYRSIIFLLEELTRP